MKIDACAADELVENSSKSIEVDNISILICKSGGEFYAIENRCTHQDTPLSGGRVRRGFVSCPLHGVLFNLRSGEPMGQLTRKPVRTFPVSIEQNRVYVDLSST